MEYYTYKDEEKGVSFDIPIFNVENKDDIVIHYKAEMFESIIQASMLMIAHDYKTVPCFVFIDAICNVDKSTARMNLSRAEEYYRDLEMYETCEEIINLKQML
jgi:hypothetical protein